MHVLANGPSSRGSSALISHSQHAHAGSIIPTTMRVLHTVLASLLAMMGTGHASAIDPVATVIQATLPDINTLRADASLLSAPRHLMQGTDPTCGGNLLVCCPGNVCDDPSLACAGVLCRSCGGFAQPGCTDPSVPQCTGTLSIVSGLCLTSPGTPIAATISTPPPAVATFGQYGDNPPGGPVTPPSTLVLPPNVPMIPPAGAGGSDPTVATFDDCGTLEQQCCIAQFSIFTAGICSSGTCNTNTAECEPVPDGTGPCGEFSFQIGPFCTTLF